MDYNITSMYPLLEGFYVTFINRRDGIHIQLLMTKHIFFKIVWSQKIYWIILFIYFESYWSSWIQDSTWAWCIVNSSDYLMSLRLGHTQVWRRHWQTQSNCYKRQYMHKIPSNIIFHVYMETQNIKQTKTKIMFQKKGGKVTKNISNCFAIAKPSCGTIIEVNSIGKFICLGKCLEIVVVTSVYGWITKNIKSWNNLLSRMRGISQECKLLDYEYGNNPKFF